MSPVGELLGESAPLVAVREQVERLLRRGRGGARRLPPVLILGETGTGKGLLASAIHRAGPRAAGPFVDVNCAAIPETLLEAELFGFERGAFTDARHAKPGLLQTAHRGVLFLDEIGLLPESLQAKLLKVLEERSVRRLGSTRSEPIDTWIVAATSEDLQAATRARRFREDLYHRLAVVTIRLPPLRERGDDVLRLADHLLAQACQEYGLGSRTLAPDARAALLAYAWPGNVRELANTMERVALLTEGGVVHRRALDLPEPVGAGGTSGAASPGGPSTTGGTVEDERQALLDTDAREERERLRAALIETRWNIARTAARLGIPRNTLRYRMEKHGFGRPSTSQERPTPAVASALPATSDQGGNAADPPDGSLATPVATIPEGLQRSRRPTTIRWESRRVALLRVRLVPERAESDVSETSRVMTVVLDKVRSFGGHVEELSPLALLAAFGLEPVDDAPRLAAYAAMAIEKVVARARREDPARPSVLMVIHTDRLLIGHLDADAVIDADAKRAACAVLDALTGQAEPGLVLASPQTATFLARRFEMLSMPAEGTAGPSFRLVGPAETKRGLTGFVGRDAELALLRDRFEQARMGEGQIVTIIGEAGIGKSRLLQELRHHVADVATWAEGHAIPLGRAIPFYPLTDLLRRTFRIDEGDTRAVIATKIEASVLSIAEDLRPILPLLGYLLVGDSEDAAILAMDPNVRRTRILDATRSLLLRLAAHRPLVLVCEDVHWIDQPTEEFLGLMAESLATARIVMILTARPGYVPPFADRTNCTRLPLTALSMAESLEIARGLVDAAELPEEFQALVVRKAEGNPFFVEEIVRTVQEMGAVRREKDRLVLTRRLDEIAMPDTIQDVIQARIDRLGDAARQTLQLASVLGKDAPLVLLRAVSELPEGGLQDVLGQLRAAEFLYEIRLFPDREYTFKHALTHEVAYTGLLPETRRALHARIMVAIEALYHDQLDDQVERLAYHAVHGELWEKAVHYLRQAGTKAFDRSSNREAAAYFQDALKALARLRETARTIEQGIDIRFDLRNALFPLTKLDLIFECLREADGLARRLDDRRRLGWVAAYMSSHLWMIGQSGEMRGVAETLRETAETLGDVPLQIAANAYLGAACLATGDHREGEQFLRTNLRLLDRDLRGERLGLTVFPAVNARARLAWSLAEQGEFGEGTRLGEEAVRMAESLDHPFSLVTACTLLAYLHRVRGDWDRAQPVLERALTLCREWGVTLWTPVLTGSLGAVVSQSGDAVRGLSLIQEALDQYEAMGVGFFHTLVMALHGEALLRAKRVEEALTCAEQTLALSRRRRERGYEAWTLRLLGEAAAHRHPPDVTSAATYYRDAMERADELGMRPLVAHCHLGLGMLCRQAASHEQAVEHLTAARTQYRDMGMASWVSQVDANLRGRGGAD